MSLADDVRAKLIGERRASILRLLVDVDGYLVESILVTTALGENPTASRNDIQADLSHLISVGCVLEDWIDSSNGKQSIRNIAITPRGDDAAHGRLPVPGVWRSRWQRG
jgi:hypothetical protein